MRGKVMILGAGLLALAVAGATPATAATSDAWITAKTKIALFTTGGLGSGSINVDTVDGRVTLHGKVDDAGQKALAEQEARKVDGVKDVRNLLQVVPAKHGAAVEASDADIQSHVKDAFRRDGVLAKSGVSVQSVNDGVVLLGGSASSVDEHLRAIQVASGVPGARSVKSEIKSPDRLADEQVREHGERPSGSTARDLSGAVSDAWITADTKMRLLADGDAPALDINVDTRNGVVTLFGMVATEKEKRAAEADAHKVNGVTRVVNQVQVVPKAKQETVKAKDDEVEQQVKRQLERREDLRNASVDVEVKNGVARLTGTVGSESDRLVAAIAARSTPGVRAVQDDLRVEPRRES
jgi:hyperosmotically inducible periplasmic protein